MVKLQPVHGFAAETTAATVLAFAGSMGMPVSTTHAITTTIMGVGCAKRFSAIKLHLVERIVWAWILTILDATSAVAFGVVWLCQCYRLAHLRFPLTPSLTFYAVRRNPQAHEHHQPEP